MTEDKKDKLTKSLENIPEIIQLVNSDDIDGVKTLLLTGKAKVNDVDGNGMTPLQHACYKGQYEMCKLLIEQGADVNADTHEHKYSALHFGALSGNADVTKLLLVSGAKSYHTNSLKRTAAQMAGFVGNHVVVALINNYVPFSDVEYYTKLNGLETEPKLPKEAAEPLYNIISESNLHPVSIILNVRKYKALLENLTKVKRVLTLMCKKEVNRPENVNEVISMKYHYLSHIMGTLEKEWDKTSEEDRNNMNNIFESLIKKLIRARPKDYIEEVLEHFVRDAVKSFPYTDVPLFLQLARNMVGPIEDSNSLNTLSGAINGQRAFQDNSICSTCGTEKKELKNCSKCKMVHYCDKNCQRLHWSTHKKYCEELSEKFKKITVHEKVKE